MTREEQRKKWQIVADMYRAGEPVDKIQFTTHYTVPMIYHVLKKLKIKLRKDKQLDDPRLVLLIPSLFKTRIAANRCLQRLAYLETNSMSLDAFELKRLGISLKRQEECKLYLYSLGLTYQPSPPHIQALSTGATLPLNHLEALQLHINPHAFLVAYAATLKERWVRV